MKELFITASGAIMLDKNADVATSVDQDASSIRRVYWLTKIVLLNTRKVQLRRALM